MIEITYVVIVAVVTLIMGALTKAVLDVVPSRFVPLQNLIIGVLSAIACIYFKVEANNLQAFVLCITAAMGAGGTYDLLKSASK